MRIMGLLAAWYVATFDPTTYPLITGMVIAYIFEYEMRRPIIKIWNN